MQFIDHTGHIFSLPSYKSNPIGYEYDMNEYIFWVDSEYGCKLSIDNVYIKPIRILSYTPVKNISVHIESNVFKLLGSSKIPENIENLAKLGKLHNYNDYIVLSDSDFLTSLSTKDFDKSIDTAEGHIYTFYLVAYTSDIGTWNSTGLIQLDSDYCPFTVGGQFFDESEELVINGRNMGVNLPKDILKAIYQAPFSNAYQDAVLYNDKLKEYLVNYMGIKGECGNYGSVLKSIEWFGYGDKITISKLIQTDNELIHQYIHDYFNIDDDIISSFKSFKASTYVSIGLDANRETGDTYKQHFDAEFYGEGNPILEDLFDKDVIEHYDEGDIDFYRPYYRYCFNEIGMKLAAMKYYLEKYFMPIYLSIHSATIRHKAYTNDVKYLINTHIVISEKPVLINGQSKARVIFPNEHNLYISHGMHYVDNKYNEFSDTYNKALNNLIDAYYIHTSVIEVPLKFETRDNDNTYNTDGYYDVIMQLLKNDECIFSEHTQFYQSEDSLYKSFIIYPRNLSRNKKYKLSDWINDKYTLCVNVNGTWQYYNFNIMMPTLYIHLGRLTYKYDKRFEQGEYGNFNMFMWHPELVEDNNIKFVEEQVKLWNGYEGDKDTLRTDKAFIDFLDTYKETIHFGDNMNYYNRVLIFDLYEKNGPTDLVSVEYNKKQTPEYIQSLYDSLKGFALDSNRAFLYDTYLMHDDNVWYIVLISRNPISDTDKKYLTPYVNEYQVGNYLLIYNRGANCVLVNRLQIEWSNGHHHFNPKDIIVCTLANSDTLSVDMQSQSKWHVETMSIGMSNGSTVNAIGNIGMLSVGTKNNRYDEGYYAISVNYNIDGSTNHTETRKIKFFVTEKCKHSKITF